MSIYDEMKKSSALSGGNSAFIEELYETYLEDPEQVPDNWKQYFADIKGSEANEKPRLAIQEKFGILATLPKVNAVKEITEKQAAVNTLIAAYRNSGHQAAATDPLNFRKKDQVIDLDPAYHGLEESEMQEVFDTSVLFTREDNMKLVDIISFLQDVYTSSIGIEVNHIHNIVEKRWIQERLERLAHRDELDKAQKLEILDNLVKAEGLERYLHTRYVGQKRFSLEGGDSLIPMMDTLIQRLGEKGTKEVVIGMAHRGRLNVLTNIMGKAPSLLFDEFEGRSIKENSAGDVKYHLGFSSDVNTPGGNLHLMLAFNPSHLEIVNPVIQGSVRARLERRKKSRGSGSVADVLNEVVPIQIHGDAAFAGQGVIQETLQLSQVRGYRVGGSIHVIINNQIGFTTSNLLDARSSQYVSDPAKIVQAPIIHVNGDDPEAVVVATRIAADYLMEFGKDVVLDLVCYRRLGHNEADEPAVTQPMMYKNIRAHKTTLALYAEKLINEGVITDKEVQALKNQYKDKLDAGETVARPVPSPPDNPVAKEWMALTNQDWDALVDTTFDEARMIALAEKIFIPPDTFTPHPIVKKLLATRMEMALGKVDIDWGFAENLAFATLLDEGYQVRLSGEDCGRGTFAHRHAKIHDYKTGKSFTPLTKLDPDQPICRIIDSILSEEAVLGFEYGFSSAEPNGLVLWEAQFGDFANGAQVLFDQFISSCETKWDRYSGLVILLPHGQEGQGPEHSSARLERYLQLCAENNMRVCMPTTPAQMFHMLRRQMIQKFRKPLIVMTPKSLLRHRLAVSTVDELCKGKFHEIIGEIDNIQPKNVRRIVFCSGKVYYDLLEARRDREIDNIAIIRMEELYPFPKKQYQAEIKRYSNAEEIIWCQEEPENQGAWRQIYHNLVEQNPTGIKIEYVGRKEMASTAAGFASIFSREQQEIVNKVLNIKVKK